jgi:hypothetical protein
MPIKLMDARLGWLQRQFVLRNPEVRYVLVKEPRVLAFGLGPIQARHWSIKSKKKRKSQKQ